MNNRKALLTVAVPLLLMAVWVARIMTTAVTGIPARLPVTGYDPRDLLAGHYVQYRIDFGEGAAQACSAEQIEEPLCICLDVPPVPEFASADWVGPCSQRPACPFWLAASCRYGRVETEIDRYYISEVRAPDLERVPDGASIEVRLDGSGGAVVTGFFVNGEPI